MKIEEVFSEEQFRTRIYEYAATFDYVYLEMGNDYYSYTPGEFEESVGTTFEELVEFKLRMWREKYDPCAIVDLYVPYTNYELGHLVRIYFDGKPEPDEF